MKAILYNNCHGGFGFSDELLRMFGITTGQRSQDGNDFCMNMENRTNPLVIQAVERIGLERASGECSCLKIEYVEDDAIYRIKEHDGYERLVYVCHAKSNLAY